MAQGPITEFDITITSSSNYVSMAIAAKGDIKGEKWPSRFFSLIDLYILFLAA
jgi:hypothetical protein